MTMKMTDGIAESLNAITMAQWEKYAKKHGFRFKCYRYLSPLTDGRATSDRIAYDTEYKMTLEDCRSQIFDVVVLRKKGKAQTVVKPSTKEWQKNVTTIAHCFLKNSKEELKKQYPIFLASQYEDVLLELMII